MFFICQEYWDDSGDDIFATENVDDVYLDVIDEWRRLKDEVALRSGTIKKQFPNKIRDREWYLNVKLINLPYEDYEKGYDYLTEQYHTDFAIDEHEIQTVWDSSTQINIDEVIKMTWEIFDYHHQNDDYDGLMDWIGEVKYAEIECKGMYDDGFVPLLQREDLREARKELENEILEYYSKLKDIYMNEPEHREDIRETFQSSQLFHVRDKMLPNKLTEDKQSV